MAVIDASSAWWTCARPDMIGLRLATSMILAVGEAEINSFNRVDTIIQEHNYMRAARIAEGRGQEPP